MKQMDAVHQNILTCLQLMLAPNSYVVIDRGEICEACGEDFPVSKLDNALKELAKHGEINVKYARDGVYCLAVTPKEESADATVNVVAQTPVWMLAACSAVSACFGAFIGAWLGGAI